MKIQGKLIILIAVCCFIIFSIFGSQCCSLIKDLSWSGYKSIEIDNVGHPINIPQNWSYESGQLLDNGTAKYQVKQFSADSIRTCFNEIAGSFPGYTYRDTFSKGNTGQDDFGGNEMSWYIIDATNSEGDELKIQIIDLDNQFILMNKTEYITCMYSLDQSIPYSTTYSIANSYRFERS
jgi:hypothetical protein